MSGSWARAPPGCALPVLQGRPGSQSLLGHREEVGAVTALHLLPRAVLMAAGWAGVLTEAQLHAHVYPCSAAGLFQLGGSCVSFTSVCV